MQEAWTGSEIGYAAAAANDVGRLMHALNLSQPEHNGNADTEGAIRLQQHASGADVEPLETSPLSKSHTIDTHRAGGPDDGRSGSRGTGPLDGTPYAGAGSKSHGSAQPGRPQPGRGGGGQPRGQGRSSLHEPQQQQRSARSSPPDCSEPPTPDPPQSGRYRGAPRPYGGGGRRGNRSGRGGQGFDSKKGTSYRRLWQKVTQVGRGQKLGEGGPLGFNELSVEELIKVVKELPHDGSAVEAIRQGLYYLDSGALAALLKELSKNGYAKRSVEIFDWLRTLDEGHELYCLGDVFTYTTMISQCGSHQQLRRALELVAEMRSRGIHCNVHTYSALMNVCIKANELDLALDVYKQMLAEGCTPNLVTYNTLIDVYGKTGQYEEAVKVLDVLEGQGIEPEIRTYNTVIIACNMSGQAQEALKVYQRMLEAGATPTATTYTALISAYGKNGQLDKALEIFEDMIARGCERNVITYSSLISACEKAGRWELALQLFDEMHCEGCRPNVVTYNSLIAACAQGAQWQKASELFDQMAGRGLKPDNVTYGGLIAAFEQGSQWREALQAFESMRGNSCRPDSAVYNTTVGVLWKTGLLGVQARALQLFQVACRQGHFRMTVHMNGDAACLEFGLHVFTVGAAVVALVRWLAELRDRAARETPMMLRNKVCLTITKGKPSREAAFPHIKQALASVLAGHKAPLRLYEVAHGCRLEGTFYEVADWLKGSKDAERLTGAYSLVDGLAPAGREALFGEDSALASRAADEYERVQRCEALMLSQASPPLSSATLPPSYLLHRPEWQMLAWNYAGALRLEEDTVHDALLLIDCCIAGGIQAADAMAGLLVAACLLTAAQEAGGSRRAQPLPSHVEAALGCPWPAVEKSMEHVRSCCLAPPSGAVNGAAEETHDGGGSPPAPALDPASSCSCPASVLRCLRLYLERLGLQLPSQQQQQGGSGLCSADPDQLQGLAGDALRLARAAPGQVALLDCPPSLVAAALLAASRRAAGTLPAWPCTLQALTGYREGEPNMQAASQLVEGLAAKVYSSTIGNGHLDIPVQQQQEQQQLLM